MAKLLLDLWDEGWKPIPGKNFLFGEYNGLIEWTVLAVEEGRMLVTSRKVLE